MSLGEVIQSLRIEHDITQQELASLVGVNFTYISKIESDSTLPSESLIRCIASIFQVDGDLLLDQSGRLDPKALQQVARGDIRITKLLRRIQSRRLTDRQLQQIGNILNE